MDWIVVQEIIAGVLIIGALYYVGRNIYKSSIEKKGDVSVCNSCSADCNKCPFHTKENKIKVSNFAKQHKNNNDKIMLDRLNLETILFLDIETVPQYSQYEEVPEKLRSLWDKKASHILKKEEETPENIYTRAGIFSEFGKIVCISVGIFQFGEGGKEKFRVKSFYDHDEKILLTGFSEMLNKCMSDKYNILCGHNIKEFDIPFIARRLIINGLPLPSIIDIAGKKPWEVNFLDTMELWKFGDYKNFTSVELLATILNIPTPKDDIDGSQVAEVYYKENNLDRIAVYCQKDVVTVAQILLRFMGKNLIEEENIVLLNS